MNFKTFYPLKGLFLREMNSVLLKTFQDLQMPVKCKQMMVFSLKHTTFYLQVTAAVISEMCLNEMKEYNLMKRGAKNQLKTHHALAVSFPCVSISLKQP